MIPQWIDCGSSAIYIGPFWMGTPEQIEATQLAIDKEIALYEQAEQQDDLEWLEDEYVPELDD